MFNATSCPIGFLVPLAEHSGAALNATITKLEHELSAHLASSVLLAVLLLLASLFVLLLGNKLVRPTLALTSFFFGAIGTLIIVTPIVDASSLSDTASCVTVGVAPLVVGLVAAGIAAFFLNLGFALLGAAAGAGLGYVLYAAFLSRWPLYALGSTNLMLILCLSILGVVGAAVMLKEKTNVLIVATSAAGASGAVPAIVLLLAHANIHFLGTFNASLKPQANMQFVWPQAALAAILFLIGLLVQCRLKRHAERKTQPNSNGLRNAQVPLSQPLIMP